MVRRQINDTWESTPAANPDLILYHPIEQPPIARNNLIASAYYVPLTCPLSRGQLGTYNARNGAANGFCTFKVRCAGCDGEGAENA